MSVVIKVVGFALTVVAGIGLSIQSGANSTLGKAAGKSFASVVSFSTGLAVLVVVYLIDVYGFKDQSPTAQSVKAAPWWAWTGGALGAYYVLIVIFFAQILGAANLIAVFVTAQLITAIVLDAFGLVGFQRLTLRWPRLLGAVLLICGVVLITVFRGEPVKSSGDSTCSPATELPPANGTQHCPPADNRV